MCLQCLLCRGLGRGRGRWLFWVTEVGARALSRLAKLFLTTSMPPARHSVWVHLGIFCCSIIPLDDWDNKQGFFFLLTHTHRHAPFLAPLFLHHFLFLFDFSMLFLFDSTCCFQFSELVWHWLNMKKNIQISASIPLPSTQLKGVIATVITCNVQQQAGSLVDLRGLSFWETGRHVDTSMDMNMDMHTSTSISPPEVFLLLWQMHCLNLNGN